MPTETNPDPEVHEPIGLRLQWVLTALEAYRDGLAPSAAMRKADSELSRDAGARRAFLAFVAAADGDRSLRGLLRRRVCEQVAAAVLRIVWLPWERARQHLRSDDP